MESTACVSSVANLEGVSILQRPHIPSSINRMSFSGQYGFRMDLMKLPNFQNERNLIWSLHRSERGVGKGLVFTRVNSSLEMSSTFSRRSDGNRSIRNSSRTDFVSRIHIVAASADSSIRAEESDCSERRNGFRYNNFAAQEMEINRKAGDEDQDEELFGRDEGVLEPKHKVFLCHSGAQKGFVWQLDENLRSWDVYPFFDKDPDSLPIGEEFPALIFKAIKECQVGVVILSEEFFMGSHWPVSELLKMVECGKKIMPIFLGVSPGDLSDEKKLGRWRSQREEWGKSDQRINLLFWEEALKLLRRLNGLVYDHSAGVVEFRKRIVKEITKIVPPLHMWDDSHVQGRSHLIEDLQAKIAKTGKSQSYGVQVVGLYGVGGIGKTTACKSLCKALFMDYDRRVCHVELGNDTSEKERVQEVLTKLTDTNKEFLKDKNLDQCWSRLKEHMHLNKVFLAIDNVLGRDSIEEAKKYLKMGYCQGSIVMVTSRARGDLKDLKIDDGDCHEMPELDKTEARSLFLYHAEPNNEVDEEVLMHCIDRCYFSKGDGRSFHYHPLALKVLGSELAGVDSEDWKMRLEEEDVFNQRREQENGVFAILRRSFDVLKDEDKLLFMDVALIDRGGYVVYSERQKTWCLFEWLSLVHRLSQVTVKKRLEGLKKKSLLEDLGDGTTQIGMHDLWREFAVMETINGEVRGGRWVYEIVRGEAEDSSLSGGGWKGVRRICVMREMDLYWEIKTSVKCLNFSECPEVTVLKLARVVVENQTLDLSALKQLKSLEIDYLLTPRDVYGKSRVLKVSGIGLLTNLTVLIWLRIGEESVSAVEEISCLTNLQVLQLTGEISPVLNLGQLRWLREVKLGLYYMESILGFSSRMTDLRILDLEGCYDLRSCPEVGDLVGLEVLVLSDCRSLKELPNLEKLTKLRILDIEGCKALESIPGLGSLVALQELRAGSWQGCENLGELPDISRLTNLEVLDLGGCARLKCIPGLGNLVALQDLFVNVQSLNDFPDLGNLTKLHEVKILGAWESASLEDDDSNPQELRFLNLAIFESVSALSLIQVDRELTNLIKLTALKSLDLHGCSLERLPHMEKHMRLESLAIHNCRRLRGWDGVGRLGSSESQTGVDLHCDWTLPHLQELVWENSGEVELPDLSHFPQLRELSLEYYETSSPRRWSNYAVHCLANHPQLQILVLGFSSIVELPDLRKFPFLKGLHLFRCENLTSLSISGPLTSLERIWLRNCSNLNAVPSVDLFPRLRSLEIEHCGVELNEQEVQILRARGFCKDEYGTWTLNPEPSSTTEIIPDSEPNCNSRVQLALDGPNDVAGPSSSEVEPSRSEFIPYNESISESAPVPKPAAMWSLGGRGFWDMLTSWVHPFWPH